MRTAGGSISGRGIASAGYENQPRALVVEQSNQGAHWGEERQEHLGDTMRGLKGYHEDFSFPSK